MVLVWVLKYGAMMRFWAIFAILLLSACANTRPAPTHQSGMMKRAFVPPIVVYPGESLSDAARKAINGQTYANSMVDINLYSLFTQGDDFFRKWPNARNNKAIAFGYPERCGMHNGWVGVNSPEIAVQKSLDGCLKSVTKLANRLNIKCGCRLTALNNIVFVDPEQMEYRAALPAVILIVKKGEKDGTEVAGLIKYDGATGKNMPLSFHNESGKKICSGLHNVDMLSMSGDFSLSCFEGKMSGSGTFKVDGMRDGRTYGTAKATTPNETLYIVYGLSKDEYEKKRKGLLAGG
jgi:hypothetical protein